MLPALVKDAAAHVPSFKPDMAGALTSVSAPTLRRALNRQKARIRKAPPGFKKPPRPRNTFGRETSVRRDAALGPGWSDADTVVHTRDYLSARDAWSVMLTDCHTGQVSLCGVRSLKSREFIHPLESALRAIPFDIAGFHSDNGSEFLNAKFSALLAKMGIAGMVSRPGKSNDNPRAEQKNGAVSRRIWGTGSLRGTMFV